MGIYVQLVYKLLDPKTKHTKTYQNIPKFHKLTHSSYPSISIHRHIVKMTTIQDHPDIADFAEYGQNPPVPGTADAGTLRRAQAAQQRLGAKTEKPRIKSSKIFAGYKPGGTVVLYADNKVGILPNLDSVINEIAEEAGIDLSDNAMLGGLVDALVTDVYVNPYSDKQAFEGEISVRDGTFMLSRRHVKTVIEKYVGTKHRRFARAMAPLIVEVMHDNPDYAGLLDKRCSELSLSTRAEAVRHFDGADALIIVDRESARRNAEAKAVALSRRPTNRTYTMASSAVNTGERDYDIANGAMIRNGAIGGGVA